MDLDSFLDDCLEESNINKEENDFLNEAFEESKVIIPYDYLNVLLCIPENVRNDWYTRISSDNKKLIDYPIKRLGSSFDGRKKPIYSLNRIFEEIFTKTINPKFRLAKDQANKIFEGLKSQYKAVLKEQIKRRLVHDSDYKADKYLNCSKLLGNKL